MENGQMQVDGAVCPDRFPLIGDRGQGGHFKVRRSGYARRHCGSRGGRFEERRSGHLSRRYTGPFEKENNEMLFVFSTAHFLFDSEALRPERYMLFVCVCVFFGRGWRLKVRRPGHARRRRSARGGHFEVR